MAVQPPLLTTVATMLAFSVPESSIAAPVTFGFEGTVTNVVTTGVGATPSSVQVGTPIIGRLSFDPELASTSPSSAWQFYYFGVGEAAVSISAGGTTWTAGDDVQISAQNNYAILPGLPEEDAIRVLGKATGAQNFPGALGANDIYVRFSDQAELILLSSTDLPTSDNDVSLNFTTANGSIQTYSAGFQDRAEIYFSIAPSSLTAITSTNVPIVPASEGFGGKERKLLGDVESGGDFNFDPTKPIVVVTHGWGGPTSAGNYTGELSDSAFSQTMYQSIKSNYGDNVNVVVYVWEEAYVGFFDGLGPDANELPAILPDVGLDLGTKILKLFQNTMTGERPTENIHFVGHSYGTKVNMHAVDYLKSAGYEVDHVTILDAPTDGGFITGQLDVSEYNRFGLDRGGTYIENYYGTADGLLGGYGSPIWGTQLADGYALNTDHAGVWLEYSKTISRGSSSDGTSSLINGDGFLISAALESSGGSWVNRPTQLSPYDLQVKEEFQFISAPINSKSSSIDFSNIFGTTLDISTASDGFSVFDSLVPLGSQFLSFDLLFPQKGDGDWLEISFNDDLLLQVLGSSFPDQAISMRLPVQKYAGQSGILSFLLASEGPFGASTRLQNLRWEAFSNGGTLAPVPLPASIFYILIGIAALYSVRRRAHCPPKFEP